jgi:hypothetical protein
MRTAASDPDRTGKKVDVASRMDSRRGVPMSKCSIQIALVVLLASLVLTAQSHATTGFVHVKIVKGGLIVGGGAGRGVLTYHGRDYRFSISGLSLGLAAGVSTSRLEGRASYLDRVSDFAGTYTAVGLGGAWVAGAGGVQLKNNKGVILTLKGSRVGLEFAANITSITIALQ